MNEIEWGKYVDRGGYNFFIEEYGYDPSGCDSCDWGIVSEPPGLDSVKAPEYLKRAIAAAHGAIVFCDCEAGKSAYRSVEETLSKIPASQIDGKFTSLPLKEAGKGKYIWSTGHSPIGYVPPTIVSAVLRAINEKPTFHGAEAQERDEEDIF